MMYTGKSPQNYVSAVPNVLKFSNACFGSVLKRAEYFKFRSRVVVNLISDQVIIE